MNVEKLQKLNLKDGEIKAFLFLLENPNENVGRVAKKTGILRTSLYGYIKHLIELGLVSQSIKNGTKVFSVVSEEKLTFIFEQKIKELESTQKEILNLYKEFQKPSNRENPKFQIFEGSKEIRNLAKDFLLYRNTETYSYWPIKSMLEILGEDFFRDFNIERIKRNIYVNAVWPENQKIDMNKYPFMGAGEEFLREIRIAPKGIDFTMGYWIYENKVAFVSSKKSNYGFILENEEFTEMLRSQFKMIWKLSKKLNLSEKESKNLFKKISQ